MNKRRLVLSQIQAVLLALRTNHRLCPKNRFITEVPREHENPLVQQLKILRDAASDAQSFKNLDAVAIVAPFLEVVKSEETTGPITGVALSAVLKFLSLGLFSTDIKKPKEGLEACVFAIRHCQFELTDTATDEAVMLKILQALVACVRSDCGPMLSEAHVVDILNTCHRIGRESRSSSELLKSSCSQAISDITSCVFRRVATGAEGRSMSPVILWTINVLICPLPKTEGGVSSGMSGVLGAEIGGSGISPTGISGSGAEISSVAHSGATAVVVAPQQNIPTDPKTLVEQRILGLTILNTFVEIMGSNLALVTDLLNIIANDGFRALLSCSQSENSFVLSLSLRCVSHLIGSTAWPHLIPQIESFLCNVVMKSATDGDPQSSAQPISGRGLYVLPSSMSPEAQELNIECLAEMCKDPATCLSMFSMYDCDPASVDLFKTVVSFLSKNSFPMGGASLNSLHTLSMDSLLSIISGLCTRANSSMSVSTDKNASPQKHHNQQHHHNPASADASEALKKFRTQKLKVQEACDLFNRDQKRGFWALQAAGAFGDEYISMVPSHLSDSQKSTSPVPTPPASKSGSAKSPLSPGPADKNSPPTLSFRPEDVHRPPPQIVAQAMRGLRFLDPDAIGTYLGELIAYNLEVLKHFMGTFDFANTPIHTALRRVMHSFKLPGEAQKIDRIVSAFSAHFYEANPNSGVANSDAAHTLSFSIIMLNTDLHNEKVKTKMTLDEFIRNNRNMNNGANFPRELLEQIYTSFTHRPFSLADSRLDAHRHPHLWSDFIQTSRECAKSFLGDVPLASTPNPNQSILASESNQNQILNLESFGESESSESEEEETTPYDVFGAATHVISTPEESTRQPSSLLDASGAPAAQTTPTLQISIDQTSLPSLSPLSSSSAVKFSPLGAASAFLRSLSHHHSHHHNQHRRSASCDSEASNVIEQNDKTTLLDRELFLTLAGPSLASITTVLKWTNDVSTVDRCMKGIINYAHLCSAHNLPNVLDRLLAALWDFLEVFSAPLPDEAIIEFAKSAKAQIILSTIFTIAHTFADQIRDSWKNVVDLVVRLYQLDLLSHSMVETDDFIDMKVLTKSFERSKSNNSSRSLLSTLFSYSADDTETADEQSLAIAKKCVDECNVPQLFKEAKFLHNDSLAYLVKALVAEARAASTRPKDSVFCIAVMVDIAVANKDRIGTIWDHMFDLLSVVLTPPSEEGREQNVGQTPKQSQSSVTQTPSGGGPSQNQSSQSETGSFHPTVGECCVLSLLRLSVRLMHREEVRNHVYQALALVTNIAPQNLTNPLAGQICTALLTILRSHIHSIHEIAVWETILRALRLFGSVSDRSRLLAIDSICLIVSENVLVLPDNVPSCVDTVMEIMCLATTTPETHHASLFGGSKADQPQPLSSCALQLRALELLMTVYAGLVLHTSPSQMWNRAWMSLVCCIECLCASLHREVRNAAVISLQRALLDPHLASLPPDMWQSALNEVLFKLMEDLMDEEWVFDDDAIEETRLRASSLLSKIFLHYLGHFVQLPTFDQLLYQVLHYMRVYLKTGDVLAEAVPETIKNMLLVMHAQGALTPLSWAATRADLQSCLPSYILSELDLSIVFANPNQPAPPAPPAQPETESAQQEEQPQTATTTLSPSESQPQSPAAPVLSTSPPPQQQESPVSPQTPSSASKPSETSPPPKSPKMAESQPPSTAKSKSKSPDFTTDYMLI